LVANRQPWAQAHSKEAIMPGKDKMQKKVATVMREYSKGRLKSSSGQKVTSQKQAVAIAMSEAGMAKKK